MSTEDDIHERKCWGCGNAAEHTSRITPKVCCQKCGSQDTRATEARSDVDIVNLLRAKGDTLSVVAAAEIMVLRNHNHHYKLALKAIADKKRQPKQTKKRRR